MPRISAPTLAEHRSRQRAALLEAARRIVVSDGPQAVTFAAVAARTGLARNSVYEYFDSPQDLLGSLVHEHMTDWTERVTTAVALADGPDAKVLAYVAAGLSHMTDEQPIARLLSEMPMSARHHGPTVELIADMVRPLASALAELGVQNPDATATYLQGAMRAAARRVTAGFAPLDEEIRTVQAFALASTCPHVPDELHRHTATQPAAATQPA